MKTMIMSTSNNSSTPLVGPIAMAFNSNVRSNTAEPIAMVNNSNVRSSDPRKRKSGDLEHPDAPASNKLHPDQPSLLSREQYSDSDSDSDDDGDPPAFPIPPGFYDDDSDDESEEMFSGGYDGIPAVNSKRILRTLSRALANELTHRALCRRAKQIRQTAAARRVLVLMDIERLHESIPSVDDSAVVAPQTPPPPPPPSPTRVLEEQAHLGEWEQYFQRTHPELFSADTVAATIRDCVFQKTGINLPFLASQASSGELYQKIIGEGEKLLFLWGALREQGSWTGVASTIMLYVRTHYSGSLLDKLKCVFTDYFETLQPQAAFSDWMDTLKATHTNWKLATNNEGFKHVSKLLSLLVGAGMVEASNLNCDVAGMKIFSDLCVPKFVSAFDIFDAVSNCVMFFVEGGYECIQAGSLRPILLNEKDFTNFEEEFMECKRLMDYATPGNYAMIDTDENTVMKRLEDAITSGKTLASLTKNPISKNVTLNRVTKLQEWESTLKQHRLSAGVRVKPYCAVAYGPTGVGKSTIAPLLMFHILQPNGFDPSDDACVMMEAGAKYEENYRTYINGMYYDDFANTKPEFTSESPCADLLNTVNTARATARMAALELKSKVSKQPKAVVVSTNVKDLNATKYSEEPSSITRRADVFLTFRVRKMFETNGMLDTKKAEAHYDGNIPHVPDFWEIDVQVSYPQTNPTPGRAATVGWKNVVWNGQELIGVDMKTALAYIACSSQIHFENQERMVKRSTGLSKQMEICEQCKSSKDVCICGLACNVTYKHVTPDVLETPTPTFGRMPTNGRSRNQRKPRSPLRGIPSSSPPTTEDEDRFALCHQGTRGQPRRGRQTSTLDPPLEEQAALDSVSADALLYIQNLEHLSRFRFDWLVPQRWTRKKAMLDAVEYYLTHENAFYHFAFGLLIPCILPNPLAILLGYMAYFYYIYTVFITYVRILEDVVTQQKQATWHAAKHVASRTAIILGTGVTIKVLYDLAQKYRAVRALQGPYSEQAFMHPTDEEILAIDVNDLTEKIAAEQNWACVELTDLPSSESSKTIAEKDLLQLCQKNTVCVTYEGRLVTNAFFIKSNVALVPTHLLKHHTERLYTIVRHDVTAVGGNFKAYLSLQHSAQIPDTDVSLVWVPSGGSWKDLTKYFPLTHFEEDFGMAMALREVSGGSSSFLTYAKHGSAQLTSCIASGYTYDIDCFVGMCGCPIMAQKIAPMIVGVHVAGHAKEKTGFAPALAQSDLEYALEVLSEQPGVLLAASTGTLKPVIYDKPMLDEQAVHMKSPVRKLPILDDGTTPNVEVYGSCSGRATYYSKVEPSSISPLVEKHCGVPQQWGKPKFGKGDPWLESLKHSSNPSVGVEPTLLDEAVDDYIKPLGHLLDERPRVKAEIKPLTRMQTVCGIDGKKFINKMAPKTAVGHPLSGPKKKYLTDLDPEDFEGFNNPAELHPQFWEEFDSAVNSWAVGERYHPVFKACMKDEPTPFVKDKVRVFQAAPMVLQLGVRMYFLPIARQLSLFPALSECAVGLNCMGPEWQEFHKHITRFGKDRVLAGDYSKYDLRLPAQITLAAFKVLISLAERSGYSERDLKIMRSIATDICYPTIAYNGDLLQFIGSNPSGQNLTVYINSIANSLLLRCAFFSMVKGKKFRDVCAAGTYGDDVMSTVRSGFDQFNHISVANFFAEHDMKFTMPDKTSTPTPYMNAKDADFLKRKNVYVEGIQQCCGALEESSIFKSLHANVRSKALTRSELSADCIDGALREWFYHGREVYEIRRTQMQKIAQEAGIDHICQMLHVTHADQSALWISRYRSNLLDWATADKRGVEFYAGFTDET